MSKLIYAFDLSEPDQDKLWLKDICPTCGRSIHRDSTVDYIHWTCENGCDTIFVIE